MNENHASPTLHVTALCLITMFVMLFVGSFIINIDVVSRGEGRIIPSKRNQVIQPLSDGEITRIYITEGASVVKGQILLEMDTTALESDLGRLRLQKVRADREMIVADSMLNALKSGSGSFYTLDREKIFKICSDLIDKHSIDNEAIDIINADLLALEDRIKLIVSERMQLRAEKLGQMANADKLKAERELLKDRFLSSSPLLASGAISEQVYSERLLAFKAAESSVTISKNEIDKISAKIYTNISYLSSIYSQTISEYRKKYVNSKLDSNMIASEILLTLKKVNDMKLRSPVDGKVEKLQVTTIGSFIKAGFDALSVVPVDGGLEMETFFDNKDIGFLRKHQIALIRLDAFPSERFGLLFGKVENIGADARQLPNSSRWVYPTSIKTNFDYVQLKNDKIPLIPGMTGSVEVITGERTLISYFFEPIMRTISEGLSER